MEISMKMFILSTAFATMAAISVASTTPASAASLFVHKGATKAPGENTCLGFAFDAATHEHLQNIQHSNILVSGAKADKFVVMMCVGSTVIISVAGDHPEEVKPLAEALGADISRMVKFD
jgi:hypothetical protein